MKLKPVVWTLEQGLALVRELQPQTRTFNYHLALGGGVLNAGESRKDLDLYFLPMDDRDNASPDDADALRQWLDTMWAQERNLAQCNDEYPDPPVATAYKHKLEYKDAAGARIDAFIL